MAFNFWEAQKRARSKTTVYLTLFILMTAVVAFCVEWAMRSLDEAYRPGVPLVGLIYLAITFLVAGSQYLLFQAYGGSYVAESLGAKRISSSSASPAAQQLLNIVEEIALASSLPVPPVYIIPAQEINAFAAGLTPDNAAITITEGALKILNRDEIQGVIAHEFGHIYNGDMKISMRLAAMVMGFFCVLYLGLRIMQAGSYRGNDEDRRGGNPIALAALLLVAAGAFTYLMGTILKSTVSREREYLADACAVQFTRNPEGIANALRKIAKTAGLVNDMPRTGTAYSHMYIEDKGGLSTLFATHPPLEKRIAAIEGREYSAEEWNV